MRLQRVFWICGYCASKFRNGLISFNLRQPKRAPKFEAGCSLRQFMLQTDVVSFTLFKLKKANPQRCDCYNWRHNT